MDHPSPRPDAGTHDGRPVVDLLLVLDVPAATSEVALRPGALAELLESRFPAARWAVRSVVAPKTDGRSARRVPQAMADARRELLAADADLAVLVTDDPVVLHGREVRSHTSPVQRCAVLSVGEPSAGPADLGPDVAVLVGDLLDLTGDRRDTGVLESLAEDDNADRDEGARGLRPLLRDLRALVGQVAASRPWLMTLHLSRSLVGASAAAFLAIVTPDFWMLADRLAVARLVVISLLVLLAGVAVLVIGGGLRERPGPGRSRRSVRLHNVAVWLGVGLGVLSLFAVLVLGSLAITLVVLPGSLVAGAIGHHAGWATMVRIGVVTAIVSLVGSVFGAGLEDDGDVQEATFGGSDDVRFSDDHGRGPVVDA